MQNFPGLQRFLAWTNRAARSISILAVLLGQPLPAFAGLWPFGCVVDFYGYRETGTVEGPLTERLRAGHHRARDRDAKVGKSSYDAAVPSANDAKDALTYFQDSGFKLDREDCGAPLFAAAFGYKDLLKEFIDRDINLRAAKFKRGSAHTPLTVASRNGQLEVVKLLLTRNVANVNEQTEIFWSSNWGPFRDGGWTPLGLAASSGHIEVVRYLIERGASTSKKDGRNYRAIDWAKQRNQREIILLLEMHDKK